MPAVSLSTLNTQINQLIWKYTQPLEFKNNLHELLAYYANRVYHPGVEIKNRLRIKSHQTPPVILTQLLIQLNPLIEENPKALIKVADSLWEDDYLEPRQLAVFILGRLPLRESEAIKDRFLSWAKPDEIKHIIELLLTSGSERLRNESPELWVKLISEWIKNPDIKIQSIGFRAMVPLIEDGNFDNLPPLFDLFSAYFQKNNNPLDNEIYEILLAFSKRTPAETHFYLRQILADGIANIHLRLVRKLLPVFDSQRQEVLREAIAKANIMQP